MSNGQNCRAPRTVKRLGDHRRSRPVGALLLVPSPSSADPAAPAAPHAGRPPSARCRAGSTRSTGRRRSPRRPTTPSGSDAAGAARMTGLQADLDRQRSRVAGLRRDIVGAALSDYASTGGLSTSASFLVSKTPGQFLNSLATTAVVEHQQASLLTQLTAAAEPARRPGAAGRAGARRDPRGPAAARPAQGDARQERQGGARRCSVS